MILGIDASNIRGGGTVTHLCELLGHADPHAVGFNRVEVWVGSKIRDKLPERPWLVSRYHPSLDRSLRHRVHWQRNNLPVLAKEARYDILFAPGGICTNRYRPIVAVSQNMLPFHLREVARYGLRWMLVRNLLLRFVQSTSFRLADGVIFLNECARESAQTVAGPVAGRIAVIPHGIPISFRFPPRPQKPIEEFDSDNPYRLLYISTVDVYKHQWNVAKAVKNLRRKGMPVVLDLVGASYKPSHKRLLHVLQRIDPSTTFINYHGFIPYEDLPKWYEQSDLFVFASSCENQPIALLEAMAAGLPIASSSVRPMPDMLGTDIPLFNPLYPRQIAEAIEKLVLNSELRKRCADDAFARAAHYSWSTTAAQTFKFLAEIARTAANSRRNVESYVADTRPSGRANTSKNGCRNETRAQF